MPRTGARAGASRPHGRARRAALLLTALSIACAIYVAVACVLLRFDLDRLLFTRRAAPPADAGAPEAFRIAGPDGAALVARRFGTGQAGCVVHFPGPHDGLDPASRDWIADATRAGLVVYAVAYPGQDGAPGHARFDEMPALATRAVARVVGLCGRTRTVVAGRSLGALVAASASTTTHPAGLVLESASPTLAAGVRAHLRERWLTRALAALPVERLLRRDFALDDALPEALHVVIFQGTADTQAPLADLWPDHTQPASPPIVAVPDGTHADTLRRATPAMIATMLDMIRGSQAEAANGGGQDD